MAAAGSRARRAAPALAALAACLGVAGAYAGRAPSAADAAPALPVEAGSDTAAPEAGPAPPPAPAGRSWFDPRTAPFIPIPEIDTSPHSGLTLGLIPTVLDTDDQGDISRILAPDLIHSQYFGAGARMRVFDYPSADRHWSLVAGGKSRVEREFDFEYAAGELRDRTLSYTLRAVYDRSGTQRFFGLGPRTQRSDESGYVNNQGLIEATASLNLSRVWQLSWMERLHTVQILPNVLAGLPSIETRHAGLDGLGTEHELQHRVVLARDTRDSLTVPRSGGRLALFAGFSARGLGSTEAYSYCGGDARYYWHAGSALTIATHAAARYMPRYRDAAFWTLSALGGDRSVLAEQQPLRAYGENRFVDRNSFAAGLELRTQVMTFAAFSTHISLELAPFFDVGKVFANMGMSPFTHLQHGAGLGIRGVASPFVVGYVDIGYGHDKAAVFSGINYPF